MLQVNLTDETNLAELVSMLLNGQQNEIILKKDDTQSIKMVLDEKTPKKTKRYFGMFKDEIKLAPDFDEWFDAMDEEIAKDFSDDPDCEF